MIIKPGNPEELLRFLKQKPLVLYGMGDTGLRIAKWCDGHGVSYLFADKNAQELKESTGKCVLTPQSLVDEHYDTNIVVSSIVYNREITEELLDLGIERERIFPFSLFIPDEVSWGELEDEERANWELMHKRYEMISEWGWIPEDVKTVADYGAGKKFIKEYLPESATYYPIDYIDRGDSTIICDFNSGQFPDVFSELSVCTGVLIYIKPAGDLINHICGHTERSVIFSTVTLEGFPDIPARRSSGICNDFTERQVVDIFSLNSFDLKDIKYDLAGNTTMTLFLFEKRDEA